MEISIGKFIAALAVTFSLFMLFGHRASTAADPAMPRAAEEIGVVQPAAPPQSAPAEYHSASGEGRFTADGRLVGGR